MLYPVGLNVDGSDLPLGHAVVLSVEMCLCLRSFGEFSVGSTDLDAWYCGRQRFHASDFLASPFLSTQPLRT
jgi:hypothetical protein